MGRRPGTPSRTTRPSCRIIGHPAGSSAILPDHRPTGPSNGPDSHSPRAAPCRGPLPTPTIESRKKQTRGTR
jgi:hypothetical protein